MKEDNSNYTGILNMFLKKHEIIETRQGKDGIFYPIGYEPEETSPPEPEKKDGYDSESRQIKRIEIKQGNLADIIS